MAVQEYPRNNFRGNPPRKSKNRRERERPIPPMNKVDTTDSDQSVVDIELNIDLHEDFPPLPKSVKPIPSPTLRKIASVSSRDPRAGNDTETVSSDGNTVRPSSPGTIDGVDIPTHDTNRIEIDLHEINSHRSSIQGTPLPRAPPPSSEEISTAGNTALSTPIVGHVHPRITPQSLLLQANATLATLQEDRPLKERQVPSPIDPTFHMGMEHKGDNVICGSMVGATA
jgi:hypothetical protein